MSLIAQFNNLEARVDNCPVCNRLFVSPECFDACNAAHGDELTMRIIAFIIDHGRPRPVAMEEKAIDVDFAA